MYYRNFQSFRTTRKSLNLWNHKSKGTRQENENGHLVIFPWAPFGSFSDSPCFWGLRELWGMLVTCFGECPSISICLLLSWLDWDSCLGRKSTEVRCHLHHMELRHPVNGTSHANWDRPAEVVFVRCPHCEVTPSPHLHAVLLGRKWLHAATCKEQGVSLRLPDCLLPRHLFGIPLRGRSVYSPPCIYLFNHYLYQYGLVDIYFILGLLI